jgi:hypothetical protein
MDVRRDATDENWRIFVPRCGREVPRGRHGAVQPTTQDGAGLAKMASGSALIGIRAVCVPITSATSGSRIVAPARSPESSGTTTSIPPSQPVALDRCQGHLS